MVRNDEYICVGFKLFRYHLSTNACMLYSELLMICQVECYVGVDIVIFQPLCTAHACILFVSVVQCLALCCLCVVENLTECRLDWYSDGECDYQNNDPECQWDGGDCCASTCVSGLFECGESGFDCQQPGVSRE